MNRRELIADICDGPCGPRVGAFFDLDGTVIDGYTGIALTQDRLRRRDFSPGDLPRTMCATLGFAFNRATFADLAGVMAEALAGRRVDDLEEMGERLFAQHLAKRVYPEARELIDAHRRLGHTVVLATSATQFQALPVARELDIEHVLCTRLAVDDGLVTGRVDGPALWGLGKRRAVEEFAAANGVDLSVSYAYADGSEDVALLEVVGNPRPTNPTRGLTNQAREHGWPTRRFPGRGRATPDLVVRSVAAYGWFLGSVLIGDAIGMINHSKRQGMNAFASLGPELALGIAGVKVNVAGEENLWSHRPAVFIFNHQSGLDAMLVTKLVRRDFAGVGKAELAHNPLFRSIGSLVDIVYVNRGDTQEAIAELDRLMKVVAADGKSIVISPEGTRSPTKRVGPFKKGPFRMAMAGGMPLVPIVIRNAHDIQPRKSLVMRPGEVDVVVLPPISVDSWRVENLDRNIATVRNLYVATLESWPGQPTDERVADDHGSPGGA